MTGPFDFFQLPRWMVAEIIDDEGTGYGLVYMSEKAAFEAAEKIDGPYRIVRRDPDGTKTVIV